MTREEMLRALQADVNAAAMLKPTAANSSRRGALVCRITLPPYKPCVNALLRPAPAGGVRTR